MQALNRSWKMWWNFIALEKIFKCECFFRHRLWNRERTSSLYWKFAVKGSKKLWKFSPLRRAYNIQHKSLDTIAQCGGPFEGSCCHVEAFSLATLIFSPEIVEFSWIFRCRSAIKENFLSHFLIFLSPNAPCILDTASADNRLK